MKHSRLIVFSISLLAIIALGFFFLIKKNPLKIESQGTSVVAGIVTASPTVGGGGTIPAMNPSIMDTFSAHDKEQLQIILEILKSKNENDPRMDQFLTNLSPALKDALQKQYSEMKMEMRSERGIIANLIARELKEGRNSPSDIQFLTNILLEKPCLSLSDCASPANVKSEEIEAHYPQLITVQNLRKALVSTNITPDNRTAILGIFKAAIDSPDPQIAQEAMTITDSIPKDENINH